MTSSTPRYAIPFTDVTDTVASIATTMANQAARMDLLLGEAGMYTATLTANVTDSKVITLSRTYPGNTGATVPGTVWLWWDQQLLAANVCNMWVTSWTGTATTITGFTINAQSSNASSRHIFWRFMPSL